MKSAEKTPPNEAVRYLWEMGLGVRGLAGRFKVGKSTVSDWNRGRVPDPAERARIAALGGPPVTAWDQRSTANPAEAARPPAKASQRPPRATETSTARQRILDQIERLRTVRRDPNATDKAKFDSERLELQCIRELAKVDGSQLTEREIAQLPAWQVLEDTIVQALEPWPEAMRAVSRALLGMRPAAIAAE